MQTRKETTQSEKYMKFPNYNRRLSVAENRLLAQDYLRHSGSERRPQPPRGVIAQKASRGFTLVWSLPQAFRDIVGWRVYKDSEGSLYKEISDRGNRQIFIEASANGAPNVAVFVSSINAYGRESRKVQIIGSASAESGAPAVPSAPPGYTSERSGGADRTVRDRTRVGVQL